jgi:2-polyprenyl-6-methoxyphenol hydroxylase-like FAD-dependent oxidoreductase
LWFTLDKPGVATLQSGDTLSELPAADLVAGCDGVNSAPRGEENDGLTWVDPAKVV